MVHKMRLLLDTANLEDIKYFTTYYPIEGVTTNPTILSKEGGDVLKLLRDIRNIIGADKELHIQVIEKDYDKILLEAEALEDFSHIPRRIRLLPVLKKTGKPLLERTLCLSLFKKHVFNTKNN